MGHDEKEEFKRCHRNKVYDESMKKLRQGTSRCKLTCALFLAITFMLTEILGGYVSGSLAIFSDAAHMASDVLAFAVSVYAASLTKRGPTKRYTYGYHRVDSMGALFSLISLWIVTIMLITEAIQRIIVGDFKVNSFYRDHVN